MTSPPAVALTTTSELTQHWQKHSTLPAAQLEVAIPAAIDALYTNRDAGGNMHSAGAAAAVAALEAARSPASTDEQVLEHALRAMVRDGAAGAVMLSLRAGWNHSVLDMRAVELLERLDAEEGERLP